MARLSNQAREFLTAVYDRQRAERRDALGPPRRRRSISQGLFPALLQGDDQIAEFLRTDQDLLARMTDYEHMDQYPEAAAALDIVADDSTQPDTINGRTVQVEADDEQVRDALEECFYQNLEIDDHVWEITRSLCKYGNDYEELLITDRGVIGIEFLASPATRRVETREDGLLGFYYDPSGQMHFEPEEFQALLDNAPAGTEDVTLYKPWQLVHMRLRSVHRGSLYGYGYLEPGRWIWKRLVLLEDSVMIFRLTRSPGRYAFYVDTGTRPPREAFKYVNEIKQQFKKRRIVNPRTGQLDLRFNAWAFDEDVFIPVAKGQEQTRIETLAGPDYQAMEDVEYFMDKFFAAIKVPKSYLGRNADRASGSILSNTDVQFARSVLRVQREVRNGLRKIARVHLSARGIDPATVWHDVYMTAPSGVYELAQLEIKNAQADFASRMREFVSLEWVLKEIFGFTDAEVVVEKERRHAEVQAEKAAMGESLGAYLRQEQRDVNRLTKKDLNQLQAKVSEILQEDHRLGRHLREVRGLVQDLRRTQAPRNGRLPSSGKRFTLDGVDA